MKLILTILLLTTSTFASDIKYIRYKFVDYAYVGTNKMIPQLKNFPKKEDIQTFIMSEGREGNIIIDNKNKKAWSIAKKGATKPFHMKKYRNYCRREGNELNPKALESLDLNLLNYILKVRNKNIKDISVFVKIKKGENSNYNNYKIFSITQNKYLSNNLFDTSYKSYTICQGDYKSSINFYNNLLALDNEYKREKEKNIKKRKNIQVADDTDQGMILEIKGPLVLIQKETCTIVNNSGDCLGYGKTTEWIKRKKLTFTKQKD